MVSLSTVYSVSIVLASLSAMGAAMVGTKVYPIQSGGDPLAAGIGVGATITGLFASTSNKIKNFFSSDSAPEPVLETPPTEPAPAPAPTTEGETQPPPPPGSIV